MEKRKKTIINTVYVLIIGGIAYLAGKYLLPVFLPFLLAFLFATLIHGIAVRIPQKTEKRKKLLSIFITMLFFFVIVAVVFLLGCWLIKCMEKAFITIPDLYENEFIPWIYSIAGKLDARYGEDIAGLENIGNSFLEFVRKAGETIAELSTDSMKGMSGYAKKIPSFIIKIVMTVVSTFFFASDYEKITHFVFGLLPVKWQDKAGEVKKQITEVGRAYLKSYSLLMLITFLELCIGLAILKIRYFPAIALGIAVFDILPVLGTGGILIPWSAIAFIIGDYTIAAGLVLLDLVITIVRNILEPKIVGKQIGLHPLAALIALFAGAKVCGIVGMIGFPVCLSILVQLHKEGVIRLWRQE